MCSSDLVRGVDLVVVARVRAGSSYYRQLEESFVRLCRKLNLVEK